VFFAVSLLRLSDLCIGFLKCKRSADVKWHDVRTGEEEEDEKKLLHIVQLEREGERLVQYGEDTNTRGAA
jgi:hypothetical protein